MYSIEVSLIPGLPQEAYDGGVGAFLGVIGHATDNVGDSANAERSYESRTFNDAFVHFFVDDIKILQVADINYLAFGAGHTANHKGYVQVELCESTDPAKFAAAYAKYTWLLAKILFDKKLPVLDNETLLSHAEVSAKYKETDHQDPISYLASHGKTWANVVADVTANYNSMAGITTPVATVTLKSATVTHKPVVIPSMSGIQIQHALNVAGYLGTNGSALSEDGNLGANSVFAIRAFQHANGLTIDGVAGPATQSALKDAADHSKEIQKALNALGYKDSKGKALVVDGDLGSSSVFAIKAFQRSHGLSADGICGQVTFTKIETALQY